MKHPAAISLIVFLFLSGCSQPGGNLPVVSMNIGSRTFNIEIAATPDSQEMGLMKRDSMPDDHGMIFVFEDERPRGFWMKNTRIPLDIVFLDSQGVVVSVHQMAAYDLNITSSDAPARYAIEFNKGVVAAAGVKVGDKITIPAEVKSKAGR